MFLSLSFVIYIEIKPAQCNQVYFMIDLHIKIEGYKLFQLICHRK